MRVWNYSEAKKFVFLRDVSILLSIVIILVQIINAVIFNLDGYRIFPKDFNEKMTEAVLVKDDIGLLEN